MSYEYEILYNSENAYPDNYYMHPNKSPNCMSHNEDYTWVMPAECEGCTNRDPHQCDHCNIF